MLTYVALAILKIEDLLFEDHDGALERCVLLLELALLAETTMKALLGQAELAREILHLEVETLHLREMLLPEPHDELVLLGEEFPELAVLDWRALAGLVLLWLPLGRRADVRQLAIAVEVFVSCKLFLLAKVFC